MVKLKIICLAGLALLAIAPIKIQSASAVIYLPENCNTYGTWNEETKTCVLNQDLDEGVEIKDNDITLDCNGHSITGSSISYGRGLNLNNKSGVTVANCTIKKFSVGIRLYLSDNNNLINNTVSNNFEGIYLHSSNANTLTNNTVDSNSYFGIVHYYSSSSVLTGNTMSGNRYNFDLSGWGDDNFTNDIDKSNLVDGKPIYYLLNTKNKIFDDSTNAGMFYCINCDNITIKNLTFAKNKYGIFFWNTHNSKIENVVASDNKSGGIYFAHSNKF